MIEIKRGGLDSEDHVDLLVEELAELDALQGNAFHSLDRARVTRLRQLVPDATVGYIMPFAGGGVPQTDADFLVLEEYRATSAMQSAAQQAGLGYVVWTVDDKVAQRVRTREGVDAIITDRPDTGLASRQQMSSEQGLAGTLKDLLLGFVVL